MSYAFKELNASYYQDGREKFKVRIARLARPFKMKHPVTKEVKKFENKAVLYGEGWFHPAIIENVEMYNEEKCKTNGLSGISSDHVPHPNLSGMDVMYIFSSSRTVHPVARINYRSFCNPIHGSQLWSNLDDNLLFVSSQLEKFTFSDSYNSEIKYYQDFDCKKPLMRCSNCGEYMHTDQSELALAVGVCDSCLRKYDNLRVQSLLQLKASVNGKNNPVFVFDNGYVVHEAQEVKENNSLHDSSYYPIIPYSKIEGNMDIPRVQSEVCVMGLGSAGSGFLDQITRCNLLRKYTLIDFDVVEYKNLRNQMYDKTDISRSKAEAMKAKLEKLSYRERTLSVSACVNKFQDIKELDYTSYKYMMLGFDSIGTRLQAFDKIAKKEYETRYILDTRYDELSSSIYFVDTQNPDEMRYYKECLEEDGKIFAEIEKEQNKDLILPPYDSKSEEVKEIFKDKFNLRCNCHNVCKDILGITEYYNCCDALHREEYGSLASLRSFSNNGCNSQFCIDKIIEYVNKNNIVLPLERNKIKEEGNTCIHWNIIDIYKFASTYLTSAIREIEEGRMKPFTHVEVTTEGLPQSMVIRK